MARQKLIRERSAAHFPAFETNAPLAANNALAPFRALVKRLSEAYGPSGSEEQVREMVRDEIKESVDQVRVDAFGNLIAQRRATGSQRKKIMLSAHLDEIGVMVTFVDTRGVARFGALGAVKPLTLLGARVQFENGTVGVIGREEKNASDTEIEMNTLFIDVGATSAENAPVRVGDAACRAREFLSNGDWLIGKALNNRIGCAILLETMKQLKKSPHDIFCVFTVQQQVGARGAGAAAYAIQPDFAFVLETTPVQDTPNAPPNGIALGKGPALKFQGDGALTSPRARQILLNAAREAHIPYQLDMSAHAAGDILPIQASRSGVPTAALGIPLRYANTSSEMIQQQDAQTAVQWLIALLTKSI
jgi:putative aminopeptidase FrvX